MCNRERDKDRDISSYYMSFFPVNITASFHQHVREMSSFYIHFPICHCLNRLTQSELPSIQGCCSEGWVLVHLRHMPQYHHPHTQAIIIKFLHRLLYSLSLLNFTHGVKVDKISALTVVRLNLRIWGYKANCLTIQPYCSCMWVCNHR